MSINNRMVQAKILELRQMVDAYIRFSLSTGGPGMPTYIPLEEKYKGRVDSVKEMEADYASVKAQLEKLQPQHDELLKRVKATMHAQSAARPAQRDAQDSAGLARQRHEEWNLARGKDYHCAQ